MADAKFSLAGARVVVVETEMITHRIKVAKPPLDHARRDSIGGSTVLPHDVAWPVCECGEKMLWFFHFDIRAEFGLPFQTGSHLSVFMCPVHNDAPENFPGSRSCSRLPAGYWERRVMGDGKTRFYELLLDRPGLKEIVHPAERMLTPRGLDFVKRDEVADNKDVALRQHPAWPGVSLSIMDIVGGIQGFKVGGQPSWAQASENHRCCCGAEMRFVCQVPENWPFSKSPDAPQQRDSFSSDDFGLFLGNEVYLFACEAQCDARAVHIVVQN